MEDGSICPFPCDLQWVRWHQTGCRKYALGKDGDPDLDPERAWKKVLVREEGWLESRSTTVPNGFESSRKSLLTYLAYVLARIQGTTAVKEGFLGLSTGASALGGAPRDSPLDRFAFPLTNSDSVCKPPNLVGPLGPKIDSMIGAIENRQSFHVPAPDQISPYRFRAMQSPPPPPQLHPPLVSNSLSRPYRHGCFCHASPWRTVKT